MLEGRLSRLDGLSFEIERRSDFAIAEKRDEEIVR
jgi:hypothetical protein